MKKFTSDKDGVRLESDNCLLLIAEYSLSAGMNAVAICTVLKTYLHC